MRVGFSSWPLDGGKNILSVLEYCGRIGLDYYNMPLEVFGWGRDSRHKPKAGEIKRDFKPLLKSIRKVSGKYDILTSMHCKDTVFTRKEDSRITLKSLREVVALRKTLKLCGGSILQIHSGLKYVRGGKEKKRQYLNNMVDNLKSLPDSKIPLGIEIDDSGFGDLKNTLKICSKVDNTQPVVDFAHLRFRGVQLKKSKDYVKILRKIEEYALEDRIFVHFSGAKNGRHVSLQHPKPDYRVFAQALTEYESSVSPDLEVVVLVESPRKEADALLFRREYLSSLSEG